MLKSHEKFHMLDVSKQHDFWIEANFKEDDEATNEGKILKFTFPDGKISYIKRDDLNQILFSIGTPADQRKMIPQTLTKVKWYETVLSVKANKDIRKGEQITFPIKLTMPATEEKIVGEVKGNKSKFII
jgi:hypothetical protein